jgi:hypothetical protein
MPRAHINQMEEGRSAVAQPRKMEARTTDASTLQRIPHPRFAFRDDFICQFVTNVPKVFLKTVI